MIYLLTAIGLTPGGSSTVHIYTQTIHATQITTNMEDQDTFGLITKQMHKLQRNYK
jgi:hypothetical protein